MCWFPSHGNELRAEQGSAQPGNQLELLALPGTNASNSLQNLSSFSIGRSASRNSQGSIKILAEGFLDMVLPSCLCISYTKLNICSCYLSFLAHLMSSAFSLLA